MTRQRPTKSTKQREALRLFLTWPTFFKSCVTTDKGHDTYKKVLSSKLEGNSQCKGFQNRTIFFIFMLTTVKREMGVLIAVIRDLSYLIFV